MRALRRWTILLIVLVGLAMAALLLWGMARHRPQDVPWAPLDLGQPMGLFTGRKLTALTQDKAQCTALLERAGIRYTALPARSHGAQCGYDDVVRLTTGGARSISYRPASLGISCPIAASLALWEWNSVQPAARALLGRRWSRSNIWAAIIAAGSAGEAPATGANTPAPMQSTSPDSG